MAQIILNVDDNSAKLASDINSNFNELRGSVTVQSVTGEENAADLASKLNNNFGLLAGDLSLDSVSANDNGTTFVGKLNGNFDALYLAQEYDPSMIETLEFNQRYCVHAPKYVNPSSGALYDDNAKLMSCTGFIEIPTGATLRCTCNHENSAGGYAFYNANKVFISGSAMSVMSNAAITIPEGAKYLRFTNTASFLENDFVRMENGEVVKGTVSFTFTCTGANAAALATRKANDTDAPLRKSLHILMFGNSYTQCAFRYVSQVVTSMMGADSSNTNVSLNRLNEGSFYLADWLDRLDPESSNYRTTYSIRDGNYGAGYAKKTAVTTLLARPWDVIVFQQRSDKSYLPETINDNMAALVQKVKALCTNPDVKVVYGMPWGRYNESNVINYANIKTATQSLVTFMGNDLGGVIPFGTAVKKLRTYNADSDNYHGYQTGDGHLALGVGCYVAGCTLAQYFFGDIARSAITADQSTISVTGSYGEKAVDVSNRAELQGYAVDACDDPWNED